MQSFGKLIKKNLNEVWDHEARKFTPWLADNIKALGEALGMELELQKQEASVGDFSLDLLAKDLGSGSLVVIENQLTTTDHNHLGKLLTYTGGFDARVIIWIAESIRDEHRQALEWLNQNTGLEISFFGVVIEVIQIDDSKPAYNFKPVVFPNEWRKGRWIGPTPVYSPKAEKYRQFFQKLLYELREIHRFTGAKKGQPQNWYVFASGFFGLYFGSNFCQGNKIRVELYIDTGDKKKNEEVFDWMIENKESIESELDEILYWERLDDKKACRIAIYRHGSIEEDNQELEEIKKWFIEKLLKFKKVFHPKLKKYNSIH